MFLPLSEQRKLRNRREGMDIQAEALGLGFSHNQTFLSDETGFYYGFTQTGGVVYWDLFLNRKNDCIITCFSRIWEVVNRQF